MKTKYWAMLSASFGLLLATVPARAHHAFAAEYDSNKPVTLAGSVTKIEWTNPHARFYVDVKAADGGVTNWEFELSSPNALIRRGWNRNSLKPGDSITVTGYLAKDGAHIANAREVTMGDGRKVFAGSPNDGGPTQ